MMYLYDGRRLIGIECSTWDNYRREYSGDEESEIIFPEYERIQGEPSVQCDGPFGLVPVPLEVLGTMKFAEFAYSVGDVQWYIDEVKHWEHYERGEEVDYSQCDAFGEPLDEDEAEEMKARFERCAMIYDLDVQKFEKELPDYLNDDTSLDNIKSRCAKLRQ